MGKKNIVNNNKEKENMGGNMDTMTKINIIKRQIKDGRLDKKEVITPKILSKNYRKDLQKKIEENVIVGASKDVAETLVEIVILANNISGKFRRKESKA